MRRSLEGSSILNSTPRLFFHLLMPFQAPFQLDIQSGDHLPLPAYKHHMEELRIREQKSTASKVRPPHKPQVQEKAQEALKKNNLTAFNFYEWFSTLATFSFVDTHNTCPTTLQPWSEKTLFRCRAVYREKKEDEEVILSLYFFFFPLRY